MSRDPFYEQILAGLNGLSDAERTLFQDCVTDLLRDTFPSLVPLRGGKDSGMDGAIALIKPDDVQFAQVGSDASGVVETGG